jgi:hypothetical protein
MVVPGCDPSAILRRCVDSEEYVSSLRLSRLILIDGEEGAGKSTIIRALLPHTPCGARVDAEDVGQVSPCLMDDDLFGLIRRNVAVLVENSWRAG